MSMVKGADHFTMACPDLKASVAFYRDVLGLKPGPTPKVPGFNAQWMYVGGAPIVHLFAQGDEERAIPGVIDHIALAGSDYDGLKARLDDMGLSYHENELAEMKVRQIIMRSPEGINVEIAFRGE